MHTRPIEKMLDIFIPYLCVVISTVMNFPYTSVNGWVWTCVSIQSVDDLIFRLSNFAPKHTSRNTCLKKKYITVMANSCHVAEKKPPRPYHTCYHTTETHLAMLSSYDVVGTFLIPVVTQ